jgi:predicted ABC-class ATPase
MAMRNKEELRREIRRIDGRGYKAYKDLRGSYAFERFILHIDHVQGDPFAAPSRLCAEVKRKDSGFSEDLDRNPPARLGLEDFLARQFARAVSEVRRSRSGPRGMGKSGIIEIDSGGQEILKRTALVADGRNIQARFVLGLPARGRTVLGREAEEMLLREVPQIVENSLFQKSIDLNRLKRHIRVCEDWHRIQAQLKDRGLVAFVADGSILPRRSGVDDRPLAGSDVVTFKSPEPLRVELELASGGTIAGMGIPEGVTLVVGGGFHGKSTLLNALSLGVYPHIPDDGREYVAAVPEAVKIRAEDGRRIERVDISAFIDNLPLGRDTRAFSTDNASGSTSQAANIVEAVEMGAGLILLDEDTSATNFMIRDKRMQRLVAKKKEPITPFIDRVRELYEGFGVSTILVMGGSGDYFEAADTIILMHEYIPGDVTEEARMIAEGHPTGRESENVKAMEKPRDRRPLPASFDPSKGKREVKIGARGLKEINFGRTKLELSALEQLVDVSQTRAVGELIHFYSTRFLNSHDGMREGVEEMMRDIQKNGLDISVPSRQGDLAMPRSIEVMAAINRMRTLKVK